MVAAWREDTCWEHEAAEVKDGPGFSLSLAVNEQREFLENPLIYWKGSIPFPQARSQSSEVQGKDTWSALPQGASPQVLSWKVLLQHLVQAPYVTGEEPEAQSRRKVSWPRSPHWGKCDGNRRAEELCGGDEPLFCFWWPPSWLSPPPSLSWTFVEPLCNLFSPLRLEWSFKAKSNHITYLWWVGMHANFLHSSVGRESTCDAGDPGSVSGLGRSAWEGIGYPL